MNEPLEWRRKCCFSEDLAPAPESFCGMSSDCVGGVTGPLTGLLLEFRAACSLGLWLVWFSLSFALDSVISGLSPAAMAAAAATRAAAPAPL